MTKEEIEKIFSDMAANPACLAPVGNYYLVGPATSFRLKGLEIDIYFDAYSPQGYNDFHKNDKISKKDLDGFREWLIK